MGFRLAGSIHMDFEYSKLAIELVVKIKAELELQSVVEIARLPSTAELASLLFALALGKQLQ